MADTTLSDFGLTFALDEDDYNALISVRDQLSMITSLLGVVPNQLVPFNTEELASFTYELELKMRDVVRGVGDRHEWDGKRVPAAPVKAKSSRAGLVRTGTA